MNFSEIKFFPPKKNARGRAFNARASSLSSLFSHSSLFSLSLFLLFTAAAALLCPAQTVAFLAPDKAEFSFEIREKLAGSLAEKNGAEKSDSEFDKSSLRILDFSLGEAVLNSKDFENPYNLSLVEAKNLGTAIGCDFFVLIKSGSHRRISLRENSHVEAFAAFYLVSARTGRLEFWTLKIAKEKNPEAARENLIDSVRAAATPVFFEEIKKAGARESNARLAPDAGPEFAEIPDANSPEAKNFRPPLPFRRLRPEYTGTAYLYNVAATVDVLLDIDRDGEIRRAEIQRWAGFGLDEAAIKAVREMNWRPAEKNGEFLPARILLRYNFKKIENPEVRPD